MEISLENLCVDLGAQRVNRVAIRFLIFSKKLGLHIIVGIVSIAPVVSKCVQQAIEAIIWKLL